MITDNAAARRFELSESGGAVFADYRRDGGTLYIDYVEAPPALRGSGAAGRLMAGVMQAARAQSLSVVPICGYAAAWIKRHPDA